MTVDRRRQARRQSEAGSVLLLMPVAMLIVVILGSLAVDRAVIFGAQRDLVAAAQVAANDAAGLGVDPDSLHGDGRISYDGTRIDQAVRAAVQGTDGQVQAHWSIRNGEVVVRLERVVDLVFARGVPGASSTHQITATASAVLRLGP